MGGTWRPILNKINVKTEKDQLLYNSRKKVVALTRAKRPDKNNR